jgi:hypothetical protein
MPRTLLAAAALLALTSQPAGATLPTVGRLLGNAIRAHFLNNETVGRAGYKVEFRGQSPGAACYTTLQVYHIGSAEKPGYSAGTGGVVRVHLEALPSGVPIGGSATWAPGLVNGGLPPGQDSHYFFHTYTLSAPACLAPGQRFGIVFENVDPHPDANWLGVEAITAAGSKQFPALSSAWAVYMFEGGRWVRREPPFSADVPIMQLCGATCISQTYMQNGGDQPVGGATAARQLLTSPVAGAIRRCYVDLARGSTAVTRVRISLTTVSGAVLAAVDANARKLPVGSALGGGQLKVTFKKPVPVAAGQQVALQISAATPGAIRAAPVQDGVGYFSHPGGWGGTTDFAQYNDGAGWAPWPGQGQISDLSAYCGT